MEYWKTTILEAAQDCGLVMTDDQVDYLANAVKGSFECYGLYSGQDAIPSPSESQTKRELEELKRKIQQKTEWENATVPCKTCMTSGTILDGWGRAIDCPNCNGAGRVKE